MPTPGTLYVVATPLGNLGDLSLRAAEVLAKVPVVAAEDTRRTRGLLSHLGARPSLLSFHAHSAEHRLEACSTSCARAGTSPWSRMPEPLRSAILGPIWWPRPATPGSRSFRSPVPPRWRPRSRPPGFPADRYLFLGFIPRKGRERSRLLSRAAAEEWSVVLFEAPPRLLALLEDLIPLAGRGPDRGGLPRADQDARGDP